MNFHFKHGMSKEDARARIEALGEYLNNRHGIDIRWKEDRAAFNGRYLVVHIEGEMVLDDSTVRVTGKDPGMLWRKKATNYLKGKLEAYLDARTPLENLPRA